MARKTGGIKKQRAPFGKARPGQRLQAIKLAQVRRSFGRSELLIAAGLAVATLAVYGQVIGHRFINFDDDVFISHNPIVARGLSPEGIAWAFTTFYDSNWHPLTWLSHMVDTQIFGLNAGAHLLENALIHVANTLLVFALFKRATGAVWRSAMVAALFALHPLHVESVAWAVERKDTLSAFFGLLSLLAYARYAEAPSWRRYVPVAVWLALGLMSKSMLVTWPFVMLLMDYWPLRRIEYPGPNGIGRWARDWITLAREKLPLFGLAAASVVVTYLAQFSRGGQPLLDVPFSVRLSNALLSYIKYLLLTVWPVGLGVYYPLSSSGVPVWQLAGALVLLVLLTALAIGNARQRPCFVTGWLWYLGTLVPVIGFVQIGIGPAMADRYFYIPSIGLFAALVFGLADLGSRWRAGRRLMLPVSVVTSLALASLSAVQITRWHDSESLFRHTLSVTSDNVVAHENLGMALEEQGRYGEAATHFAEALRIMPDRIFSLVNMGLALRKQGKAAEAIGFCEQALRVKPNHAKAHWELGLALADQGKNDDAQQEFLNAMELAPPDFDTRMDLGLMLTRQGKLSEAITQLNEAVHLKPDSSEAHNDLGLVLLMAEQPEKSIPHFSAALRLKPDLAVTRDNLRRAQKEMEARQK